MVTSSSNLMLIQDKYIKYLFLLDVDFATRKIAACLAQTKVIVQEGGMFSFQTLSTFRNYELAFTVGVEFNEYTKGLDNINVKVSGHLKCEDEMRSENDPGGPCVEHHNVSVVIYRQYNAKCSKKSSVYLLFSTGLILMRVTDPKLIVRGRVYTGVEASLNCGAAEQTTWL